MRSLFEIGYRIAFVIVILLLFILFVNKTEIVEAGLAEQINPKLQDQHYSRPQLIRSTRQQNNVFYGGVWHRRDGRVGNWWTNEKLRGTNKIVEWADPSEESLERLSSNSY